MDLPQNFGLEAGRDLYTRMFPGAFANGVLMTENDAVSAIFFSSWCIVLNGGDKGPMDLPQNFGLEAGRDLYTRMFPGAFANGALMTENDAVSAIFFSSWCIVLTGGDKGLMDLPQNFGLEAGRDLYTRMFPGAFANGALMTENSAVSEIFFSSWCIVGPNSGDKGLLDLPQNFELEAGRDLYTRMFPDAFANGALMSENDAVSAIFFSSWCIVLNGGDKELMDLPRNVGLAASRALHVFLS
jgi:hypothetical protein